jgi:Calcineurin-like phosphoesterase
MSNIRYIIVSDLHLAAANSVLTRLTPDNHNTIPHDPSDLLRKFVACLQYVLSQNEGNGPVWLILNGDILELALAGTNEAGMTFEGFLRLLFRQSAGGNKLAREIFYLPGNHDHHLWNTAKETQYVEKYLRDLPAGEAIAPEYYVTNMFHNQDLKAVPAYLLNTLVRRLPGMDQLSFTTVYPNFALLNSDKTRAVIFHHGQYIEPIYSLMSRLRDIFFPGRAGPDKIWNLEAENGAWIDFFWSTLGRSGDVGTGIGLIYAKMQNEEQFNKLLENLARAITAQLPAWMRLLPFKLRLITKILEHTVGQLATREVHETDTALSPDTAAGLKHYLEKYVLREIKRGNHDSVPADVTFIFGHTHKPFQKSDRFSGYSEPVKLLNSGGWVVDTCDPNPLHGGAIIFVDDELNVASIRMYNEGPSSDWAGVHVAAAVTEGNPLFDWLSELIKPDEEPWNSFSNSAEAAVKAHRENLLFNISRTDTGASLISSSGST